MDDRQPSQTALAAAAARAAHLVDQEPLIFRDPVAARIQVFEVDHPASQRWKCELLAAAQLTVAEQVRQQVAIPAALWRRSDALRPADLCRLARATVSG